MSYNKVVFEDIYDDCLKIMQKSNDRNVVKKQKCFEQYYNEVTTTDNYNVQEFFAIAHELRTYEMLKYLKMKTTANNDDKPGPDFICNLGNLECVTFMQPSDEKSKKILKSNINRYKAYEPKVSQAIYEKFKKFQKYIEKNNIDQTKPNIICLNAGICKDDIFPTTLLRICEKILFGLGYETLLLNPKTNEEIWFRSYEDTIQNHNEKEIDINFFNFNEFSIISAVLLIINSVDEQYSKPILFINPKANVKIDKRKIKKFLCLEKVSKDTYEYFNNGKQTLPYQYNGIYRDN